MTAEHIVSILLEGTELKYWMSPNGDITKCSDEHGLEACSILGIPVPNERDPDDFLMRSSEIRDKLMRKGYARVNLLVGKALYIDYVLPLTPDQEYAAIECAKRLGVELIGI
jgi:hypothetical protein